MARRRTSDALTVDRVQVGRLFALGQGAIWLATLSGTAFRTGWVLGLLAIAAAVSARSHPGRSVALLVGPAAIIAVILFLSLSRSQLDVRVGTATSLASEVLPGLLAGVLVWTGRARPEQGVTGASVRFQTPPIGRPLSIALGLAAIAALPVALSFNMVPPNHANRERGVRFASDRLATARPVAKPWTRRSGELVGCRRWERHRHLRLEAPANRGRPGRARRRVGRGCDQSAARGRWPRNPPPDRHRVCHGL